jgi:hypothetical protein
MFACDDQAQLVIESSKMNEISVIQSMANSMNHLPMSLPADLTSPHQASKHENKPDSWRKDEELKKESNGAEVTWGDDSYYLPCFELLIFHSFLVPLRS